MPALCDLQNMPMTARLTQPEHRVPALGRSETKWFEKRHPARRPGPWRERKRDYCGP